MRRSKVGISTQGGRMGYLSLISYLREGTSLPYTCIGKGLDVKDYKPEDSERLV